MHTGTLYSAPGQPRGFMWFWADGRLPADHNYHEHKIADAQVGVPQQIGFSWLSGGDWNIIWNYQVVGWSEDAGDFAGGAQSGIETSDLGTGTRIFGHTTGWTWADTNWGLHAVGNEPFDVINVPAGNLLDGYVTGNEVWAYTYYGCDRAATPPPEPAEPLAVTPTVLTDAVHRLAAYTGEPAPTGLRYVKTTRQAANKLDAAQVNTDQSVYFIEARGHFKLPSSPYGTTDKPGGSVLTATIDATTGEVLDWGFNDTLHDLASLGQVSIP